ncbi:GNAT family N-acetyltransferase [Microvirga arsenatis]|uniref:GNAT family N-acetyltransferase n=1 Tax=Microvirga arsenatis TaxID=2692265 RepID=A0ABW9YYH8_9HYPH|nr:GNAT family N-acetyltransferase [Microvirga arsenatis]NBJ11827.1 GNAT family N-acetyltransferase [Microvirga arsenatis]NBJ25108.1 GNAT family N-acetyltransferase [Microvirga arsenatis]
MTAELTAALNLNGYTDLPAGKIATVVTYLEMRAPPPLPRFSLPGGWTLQRIDGDRARYRALFRRVGEPWLWFSRAVMPDSRLASILDDPAVEAYALHDGQADIGLMELDLRSGGEAELAFLGLAPGFTGQGAGRLLMSEAIARAFSRPIRRLFVHTCTLDSPAALPFYIRSGFTPYKRALEVVDDPRLLGLLPRDAAPHIPILAPSP